MRRHDHANPGARAPQRVWLKLVQTLLHLSVLLGGALGLPQSVASAALTPVQDAQTRGELAAARDACRAALVNAVDKRTPDTSSPPDHPPAAAATSVPQSETSTRAAPVRFVARLRSKPSAHPFQARAPPRKS